MEVATFGLRLREERLGIFVGFKSNFSKNKDFP
jgi:hypothetical protein